MKNNKSYDFYVSYDAMCLNQAERRKMHQKNIPDYYKMLKTRTHPPMFPQAMYV